MMAQYGDVVGMTGANEAELMCELRIPMAMIAMVDNFANGITGPLTFSQFKVSTAIDIKEYCICFMGSGDVGTE